MNNFEIKEKIDFNNKLIEEALTPNKFILNNTVSTLLKENDELQRQCNHEFVDGVCIYCYRLEDN